MRESSRFVGRAGTVVSHAPGKLRTRRPRTLEGLNALLFLGPKGLLFAAFVIIPFGYTFILIFEDGNLLRGFTFVGLQNFGTLMQDSLFWQTLEHTGLYMLVALPLSITVPLAIAVLLTSTLSGLRVYRTIIYMPSLLSIVATGLVWQIMIDPSEGPVYHLFNVLLRLHIPWLNSGAFALVFIALISVWSSLGFLSIIFVAAINEIPPTLSEAAAIDGANAWDIFWWVKLPLLRPVIQLVLVLVTVWSIQVFDVVYVLTQGGPGTATYTVMWYVYQNVFGSGSVGYAAAMGVLILLITLAMSIAYIRGLRVEGTAHE